MKSAKELSKRRSLKLAIIIAASLSLAGFAWSDRSYRPERVEGSSMTEADIATSPDPEKARGGF